MSKTLAWLSVLFFAIEAFAGDVKFDRVSGENNGILTAFQEWHRLEMMRQGGPGKSHGWWLWGLRAFDFDNDGVLDFLASHHGIPHSMLLRGQVEKDGTLRFSDITKSLGVDNRDLPGADDRPWIWDFDGDGFLDIAGFSDESSPNCAWNKAGKEIQVTKGHLFGTLAHPREVADINGDGYLDLDGGSKGQWIFVPEKKLFRHDPSPRFAIPPEVTEEQIATFHAMKKNNRFFHTDVLSHDVVGYDTLGYHPQAIDFDGDGLNDVAIAGSGGYGAQYAGRYLRRQKDGSLVDWTAHTGLPENGTPVMIRDLTGDGCPEILVVSNKFGEKSGGLFLNDGQGKFRRMEGPLTEFLERRGPYLIRAYQADFDNDGLPDIVLSNPRLGQMRVYHNEGDGKATELLKIDSCWDSNPIVLTDLDHDGRIDIAVGVRPSKDSPGDIHLFFNRTKNAGHYLAILPRMPTPNPFAVGAVVEVYSAGDLAKKSTRPVFVQKTSTEGTPVLASLGGLTACDVRVIFPGGAIVTRDNVTADQSVTIKP